MVALVSPPPSPRLQALGVANWVTFPSPRPHKRVGGGAMYCQESWDAGSPPPGSTSIHPLSQHRWGGGGGGGGGWAVSHRLLQSVCHHLPGPQRDSPAYFLPPLPLPHQDPPCVSLKPPYPPLDLWAPTGAPPWPSLPLLWATTLSAFPLHWGFSPGLSPPPLRARPSLQRRGTFSPLHPCLRGGHEGF